MTSKPAYQRFEKASKNVLNMVYAGLKGMFVGLLSEPRKFIVFVVLLILLILVSYYVLLLLFLTPIIIFYIALYVGRGIWEERRKRRVGRLGSVFIFIVTILIVSPCLYGYFVADTSNFKTANLPKGYTDAGSHNGWNLVMDPNMTWDKTEQGGLVRASSRSYEFDKGQSRPYPGLIFILTLKSTPMTNMPYVADSTERDVASQLEKTILGFTYNGLTIDRNSKVSGTGKTMDGHTTMYFEYNGKVEQTPNDARLSGFVSGAKVKIRGETWKCSESGTIVSVAGVAQYGYTFAPGTFKAQEVYAQKDYPDDIATWTTVKNLINNVKCK
jgi:hypothetical protein